MKLLLNCSSILLTDSGCYYAQPKLIKIVIMLYCCAMQSYLMRNFISSRSGL